MSFTVRKKRRFSRNAIWTVVARRITSRSMGCGAGAPEWDTGRERGSGRNGDEPMERRTRRSRWSGRPVRPNDGSVNWVVILFVLFAVIALGSERILARGPAEAPSITQYDHLCISLYLYIIGHNDGPEHVKDDALFEMAADWPLYLAQSTHKLSRLLSFAKLLTGTFPNNIYNI